MHSHASCNTNSIEEAPVIRRLCRRHPAFTAVTPFVTSPDGTGSTPDPRPPQESWVDEVLATRERFLASSRLRLSALIPHSPFSSQFSLRFTMRLFGCFLLWAGLAAAATSQVEGFSSQAEISKTGTASVSAAAAENDYTCSKTKLCKIGCCGPL